MYTFDIPACDIKKGDRIIAEISHINCDNIGCSAIEVNEQNPIIIVTSIKKSSFAFCKESQRIVINKDLYYKYKSILRVLRY